MFFLRYVVDIKCNCFSISLFLTAWLFFHWKHVPGLQKSHQCSIVKLSIKSIYFHLATKSKSVSLNVQGCNHFSVIYKAGSGKNFFKYWLLLAAIFPGRRTEQSCYWTWKCVTRKDFFVNHIILSWSWKSLKLWHKAVYAV